MNLRYINLKIHVCLAKENGRRIRAYYNGKKPKLFGVFRGYLNLQCGMRRYYGKSLIRKINFAIKLGVNK